MNKGSIMLLVTLLILWFSDAKAATVWGSTDRAPATGTMRFPVDINSVSTPGYLDVADMNTYIWANPTGVLPRANGGLGVSLVAPGADRILFWDHSSLQYDYLTAGTGLSITGTTISATSAGSGTVTSVNVSGGTTGLTYSGGPVTTSGTITTAGTLAVANGGTGANSAGGAQTNLNLIPGVHVQAYNQYLESFANNDFGDLLADAVIFYDQSANGIFVASLGEGIEIEPGPVIQVNTELQAWAAKTIPTGAVVGTTDTQTLTNKTLSGKVLTTGTALTSGNLSSCGTTPTITGTDRKGTITTGGDSTECRLTFGSAYSAAPVCVVTQVGADTGLYIFSVSTTLLRVAGSSWAGGEVFAYVCEG